MNMDAKFEDLKRKGFEKIRNIVFELEGKIIGYNEKNYIIKEGVAEKVIEELYKDINIPKPTKKQEKRWIRKGVTLDTALNNYIDKKQEIYMLTGQI